MLCIGSIFTTLYELVLIGVRDYLTIWNILDFVSNVLIFINSVVFILYENQDNLYIRIISSLNIFMIYFYMLSFFRILKSISFLITLVYNVFKNLVPFLFLLLIVILGFTFMTNSLQLPIQYSTFDLFHKFYRLLLGDFDTIFQDVLGTADQNTPFLNNPYFMWAIFYFATLILFINMFNLLVSIIGEQYEQAQSL
jgi:hypothetical protein